MCSMYYLYILWLIFRSILFNHATKLFQILANWNVQYRMYHNTYGYYFHVYVINLLDELLPRIISIYFLFSFFA